MTEEPIVKVDMAWFWCTGCGKWHPHTRSGGMHHLMYCEWEEPDAGNFEGTLEELRRFQVGLRLRRQDELEGLRRFKERIDAILAE